MSRTLNPAFVRRVPLVLAVCAAIAFLALGGRDYVSLDRLGHSAAHLRDIVRQHRVLAPFLFIAAYAALLLALVVPAWLGSVVAGLLFGPWLGTLYALLGATTGATMVFLAARSGFGNLDRAGPRVARFADGFRRHAFLYLVTLRLLPVVSFTLLNITAAVCGQSLRSFVLGTFVGIVPSVLIYAHLAAVLLDMAQVQTSPDPSLLRHPGWLVALTAFALLPMIAVLVINRRELHRGHGN